MIWVCQLVCPNLGDAKEIKWVMIHELARACLFPDQCPTYSVVHPSSEILLGCNPSDVNVTNPTSPIETTGFSPTYDRMNHKVSSSTMKIKNKAAPVEGIYRRSYSAPACDDPNQLFLQEIGHCQMGSESFGEPIQP